MERYSKTPIGKRAIRLVQNYKMMDRRNGFGDAIDFNGKWVMENIMNKPCVHCGKEGWDVIGCNRIDNSKPHTKDNVEPCCKECNDKLNGVYAREQQGKKVYQYTLDGELVKIWDSTRQLNETSEFKQGNVAMCCRGGYFDKRHGIRWVEKKQYKGYRWSYEPL